MGKASRTKQDSSRREKIAVQRAAAKRAERQRRLLLAGAAVVVVIAVVVSLVVVKLNQKNTPAAAAGGGPTGTALSQVVSQVTTVPGTVLDKVGSGSGSVTSTPKTITGATLTSNGKPQIFYAGAEYCPYCAAERWAMIVALSRFGTFSGLQTIRSAVTSGSGSKEPFGNTPTWTFAKSTYTSNYVTFTPVEMQTNIPDPSSGGYTNLQTPTNAQNALLTKYDGPQGSIPFIDFGNKYMISGASYDPGVLAGLSWQKIATDLKNPSSPVAKGIDGAANYMTAAICKLTGNQPSTVCTSAVQTLQSQI